MWYGGSAVKRVGGTVLNRNGGHERGGSLDQVRGVHARSEAAKIAQVLVCKRKNRNGGEGV